MNRNINGSSTTIGNTQNNNCGFTPEGGYWISIYNNSGGRMVPGTLLEPSYSDYFPISITIGNFSSRKICGILYEELAPYTIGKMVIKGPCQVYFNPNGSTFGQAFRMSFTTDHISANYGMAESESIERIAGAFVVGKVFETRTGEGLAWCLI